MYDVGGGASNYQRTPSVNAAFSDNLTKQREDVSNLKPVAATTDRTSSSRDTQQSTELLRGLFIVSFPRGDVVCAPCPTSVA